MRTVSSARFAAGIRDNSTRMRISVQIQRGNIIGIVFFKCDAVKIAKSTGDLPQNVNFATLRRCR